MLFMFFQLLLIVIGLPQVVSIKVSTKPFILNLQSLTGKNMTTIIPEYRSNSKLFQNVLNIKPGCNASVSYDKWYALKASKLFNNLTMEAIIDENGDIQFIVNGIERPMRSFSPEISLSSDRFGEPQISGGIQYSDKNFRGLGETFNFILTQPDPSDNQRVSVDPDITVSWADNAIG